ncbi:PDR/VanB family oxidoreductase [Mycolicibacterium baixiangningiae]|uniref:PDR/VanB family oxidoreductase n=1 Tax=Mycolicibacterium baixiangningiae TaxID=2761578 RepID=UPI001865D293|nr:PDR/VanB family oxidoreductase [Mycolicibacterium baixiangningiae]
MKLRVTQLRLEATAVVSVVLEPISGDLLPEWEPGAHVAVTLPSGLVRQYSLCGLPGDRRRYTIAVLLVADGRGGSREIHQNLRVGEVLEVGDPRNDFALEQATRYLFLAGGIGITPILTMMERVVAQSGPPPVRLIYGGRSRTSMPFLDRLGPLDGIDVVPEDEVGLPDLAGAIADAPAGTHVYCCGPPAMLAAVQGAGEGRPDLPLHFERFTAGVREVPPSDDGAFDVELVRSGVTVTVGPGTTVLDAVLEVAPDTPFSCTGGFCGTCETKVVSGDVDHRDDLLTEDERRANSTMMICVSRARGGGRLVLDL